MPLASSNRMRLTYKPEATYGVPVIASPCYALRNTGESLDYGLSTITSNEIRSDRAVVDLITTDADASGGFNFELSYGEYDWFLESLLQSTFTVFGVNGVGAAIPTSATFTANTLTAGSATSGASIFTNLVAGQWVKVAGSSNALQNIWAQVSLSVPPTATVLTFEGTPFTGATGAGGAAVTVSSSRLTNGTTQRSCTIERAFQDVTQFFTHRGQTVQSMTLDVSTSALVTGSFDFMGKDMLRAGSTGLNATVNSSLTNGILSAVNSVANVLEGGAALTNTFIQSLKMTYGNNLRGQKAIGVLGNAGIGSGLIDIKLNLSMYFADGTLYDKFLNSTASSFSWRFQDVFGSGYVYTIPKDKISVGKTNATQSNTDVVADFEITGLLDPTTNKMMLIDRGGVAVVPAT
jgi:Phage tail tube protein